MTANFSSLLPSLEDRDGQTCLQSSSCVFPKCGTPEVMVVRCRPEILRTLAMRTPPKKELMILQASQQVGPGWVWHRQPSGLGDGLGKSNVAVCADASV